MESGNENNNVIVEIDLSEELSDRLEFQEEILVEVRDYLKEFNDNFVKGVGVLTGLIGVIIGFMAAKELLKLWLH